MIVLQDKRVLIAGLGESGLAMARWCSREGAQVRVTDTRRNPPGLDVLRTALPQAEICCGNIEPSLLDDVALLAISPGLSPLQSPQRELLIAANERGILVVGEIELFAAKLAALKAETGYAPKVLAITGTNGKTTVTRLTGLLCQRAGLKTRVAGNIGPAALDALTDALQNDALPAHLPQVWVLELSSFQLETTRSLVPDAATVLNITQDHLDWHGEMAAYTAAKARIFAPQTVQVLNRDDSCVMAMVKRDAESVLSFGLDTPVSAGQYGLLFEGGIRWLAVREWPEAEESRSNKASKKKTEVEIEPGFLKRLMPAEALQIRGDHNIANALAALALCRAIGLPMAPLLHGLRDYAGEPHRVELVMTLDDIDYVDDSKGTNVGATVAALNGLGSSHGQPQGHHKIVLIAGGDGKGQDFTPLVQPIARHVRNVILIGRDATMLRTALAPSGIPITDCANLEVAVHTAAALALPGDTVLLSPACASLDMFRNYEHRADVFINAVRELALEDGQLC